MATNMLPERFFDYANPSKEVIQKTDFFLWLKSEKPSAKKDIDVYKLYLEKIGYDFNYDSIAPHQIKILNSIYSWYVRVWCSIKDNQQHMDRS